MNIVSQESNLYVYHQWPLVEKIKQIIEEINKTTGYDEIRIKDLKLCVTTHFTEYLLKLINIE